MNYEPDCVDLLVKAVRKEYESRGNDADSATAFTLGYITSMFRDAIELIPKAKRKQFEAEILRRVNYRI